MRTIPTMKLKLIAANLLLALPGALAAAEPERVLIFSHSTGYRHASIEPGVAAIRDLVANEGIEVEASEAPALFDGDLSRFDAIVLVSTTTDPKRPESEWFIGSRREALQRFVRGGGGIVAIHAAADSHYHWPWYGRMIGGRFESHPPGTPRGTLNRASADHPAVRQLPERFERTDEWYYFQDWNPTTQLLLTLDPGSIGEKDVNPNPIAWAHAFEGGRVFYTAMGHTEQSFAEPLMLEHLRGGLLWAVGRDQGRPMVVIDEGPRQRQEQQPHSENGMSTADRISDSRRNGR